MKKNNKKIASTIVATSVLISSTPIQTFANEIDEQIDNINSIITSEDTIEESTDEGLENTEQDSTKEDNVEEDIIEEDNTIKEDDTIKEEDTVKKEDTVKEDDVLNSTDSSLPLTDESVANEDIQKNKALNLTVDNKYIVSTLDDLKLLRTEINDNNLDTTGIIVELGADIDFSTESEWESIGTKTNGFKGTFDGKGFKLKNLSLNGVSFVGIFDYADNAVFKNINIENINIVSPIGTNVGIICGTAINGFTASNITANNVIINGNSNTGVILGLIYYEATMDNITISNTTLSGGQYVGGVVGYGYGNFTNIKSNVTIEKATNAGGLAGQINSATSKTTNILSNINVNVNMENITGMAGGVSGAILGDTTISGVTVEGVLISSSRGAGGVTGQFSGSGPNSIECSNININVNSIKSSSSGGIVGTVDYLILEINNVDVRTDIVSTSNSGGIIGYMSGIFLIKDANVVGNISSNSISGGIIGCSFNGGEINNTSVISTITANSVAGGIIGQSNGNITANNNKFNGEIVSQRVAGGIFGANYNDLIATENTVNAKITSRGNTGGFAGNIYGNSNTISQNIINVEIENKAVNTGGMIGFFAGGTKLVENNDVSASIIGTNYVGGMFGEVTGGKLDTLNNTVDVNIQADNSVGGIAGIGRVVLSSIKNNKVKAIISGSNEVGGIAGRAIGHVIENNKVDVQITAVDSVGGIAGASMDTNSKFSKNSISGSLTATSKTGGITGNTYPVSIDNNLIIMNITADNNAGGIIGYTNQAGSDVSKVTDCVVVVNLTGNNSTNALVGQADYAEVSNVYYDSEVCLLPDALGIALKTSQMQGKGAIGVVNLDFENIWTLNKEFYPTFEQINYAPDIIPNQNVVDSVITITQYDKFNPMDYITVEDFEGDEVTVTIKEDINTSNYGTFKITYVATDIHGLSSELALNLKINPVMVGINNIPTITIDNLIGNNLVLTQGQHYNPLDNVTAFDKEDNDITKDIEVIENTVNINRPGEYKVVYKVTDSQGATVTKEIKVIVIPKLISLNNAPVINAGKVTINVGDKFNPLDGVTATDKEDGDITKNIEVIENTVDTTKAGKYKVVYKVTDSQGTIVTKEIKVIVKDKTTVLDDNTSTDKPQTGDYTFMSVWAGFISMLTLGFVNRKKNRK